MVFMADNITGIKGSIQTSSRKNHKKSYDRNYEKKEITDILCKNIEYDFATDYSEYLAIAAKQAASIICDEWEENREIEEEEIAMGEKDPSARQYDRDFNADEHKSEINSLASKLFCRAADVQNSVVLNFPESQNLKTLNKFDILPKVSAKTHFEATDCGSIEAAKSGDILRQKTFDSVENMLSSKDFKTFLMLKNNLSRYSHNNIAMIYGQNPQAKLVNGLAKWNELGRTIAKGEKGLQIWCPKFMYLKNDKDVDNYLKYYCLGYSQQKKDDLRKDILDEIKQTGSYKTPPVGYNIGYVFDISQTEPKDKDHDNYDQLVNLDKPLDGTPLNAEAVSNVLRDIFIEEGVNIPYDKTKGTNAQLYDTIYKYSECIMQEKPSSVAKIKSIDPSEGRLDQLEVFVATGLICEHIGIEHALEKVGLEMAKLINYKNDALESPDKFKAAMFEGGRHELFKQAFDRGSALSDQFNKKFDKDFDIELQFAKETAPKEDVKNQKSQKDSKDIDM